MTKRPATSRWRASAVSYGPLGRIIATAIVAGPAWWMYAANVRELAIEYKIGYFFAAALWTIFVVPVALRDIWRRVPNRDAPAQLILPAEKTPPAPGESIMDRKPPPRW